MIYGLLLFCLACALARRMQGLSKEEWPLLRQYRMLVLWVPLALIFMGVGTSQGLEWYWSLALGAIPGLWSWLPGKYNTFLIWRLLRKRVHTAYTEMIQGGLGAAIPALILGVG